MNALRASIYYGVLLLVTPFFFLLAILVRPLPGLTRYRIVTVWTKISLWLIWHVVGMRFRVKGRENIPQTPSIILSKHQSAWETMALQAVFPAQCFVMKRELLRLPFFGWALGSLPNIPIDRKAGKDALQQVAEHGKARLAEGFWVVVFPEGTRVPPGQKRRYKAGGAHLAIASGAPVVPVAHNAGEFWPRNSFLKRPGTVTVSVGPAIDPRGLSTAEINARAEAWIEAEMHILSPHRYEGEVAAHAT